MAREPYRFISYDSRDENLVQFYIREINGAPYLNFTYISPRDKRWADIIEANDIIFFIQDNLDVASAEIAAPYDSENGFRLSEVPSPALNEGNYYGLDYSRDRPEDDRDVPIENRGWSPLYGIQYLTFDDPGYSVSTAPTTHFAFRLVDWTSGRGTKPQTGYLGTTGIVADVVNAAILTLPPGPRGPQGEGGDDGDDGAIWTEGTTLSNGNVVGDMHLFPEAVASGLTNYFQANGTTAKADAEAGEVARWDGTKWRFVMVLSTGGLGGIFVDMHDGLRDATADDYGKVGIGPDGKLYRVKRTANPGHDAAGTFNAYTHAQYRGVAHNRPSNPQVGETYYNIRIHQWYVFFLNQVVATIDAQPITAIQALGANTVWLGEVDDVYQARHAIQNFDNTKAYYAVYGETLYVLDNSTYTAATTETTYTYRWIEILPDDVVTTAELQATVEDKLLPTYPPAGSRNDKIAKFSGDTLQWEDDIGEGLTPQQKAQYESLVAKTADLLIETRETWVAATDASFLALSADNAQLARVRAGNVPQGLSGWTTDVTTTDARVILIRVPVAAQLADYRILLGDDNAVRLDAFGVNVAGTTYAYMTPTSLVLQKASRIRLQHHGTATHTRFIGMLADAIMARLLPTLPAENDRDGKVPRFSGNNLIWEILTGGGGGGLTTSERARLLPNLPNAGDRNLKIAQFVNDVLTWKLIEGFVTEETFRDYRPHTPERGDTLPVRLEPQGTFILQETSHWSDKLYPFYPVGREIVIGGRTFNDVGTIEVGLSSELTPFESTDNPNPAIFSATRVAGIYMRSTNVTATEAGYAWRPKIVLDRALFPSDQGAYDYSGLSIKMRVGYEGLASYHHASLFHSAFNRDGDESSGAGVINELTIGGRTYVCFVPDNRNFHWRQFLGNAANNNAEVSFQILKSKSASPAFPPTDPQFLSDDPTTAWVDGDEFVAGLYEGDANGHPVPRILPPLALWNDVVARSDTYIRGGAPDARFGVEGNKWLNLSNGKGYIKNASNAWVEVVDFALQAEVSAILGLPTFPAEGSRDNKVAKFAGDVLGWEVDEVGTSGGGGAVALIWEDITNGTTINRGTIVYHGAAYFGCLVAHSKGATGPDGDPTNWIILTNFGGTWSNKWYPPGVFVVHASNPYVSLQAVVRGDPQPNANNNTKWLRLNTDISALATTTALNTAIADVDKAVFAELGISASLTIPQPNGTAIPLTYAASLEEEHNSSGVIGRATAGNAITVKAGAYVIDVDMNVSTESSGENARSNIEFTVYNGSTLLKTKRGGYLRSLTVFDEQVTSARFTLHFGSDATIQIRVKMHDNDLGSPTITTQAGGSVVVRRIGT